MLPDAFIWFMTTRGTAADPTRFGKLWVVCCSIALTELAACVERAAQQGSLSALTP